MEDCADESILDPSYCPPEQYCLPTNAPHLGRQLAPLKMAISPLLWSRHKPDCFDSFSTGCDRSCAASCICCVMGSLSCSVQLVRMADADSVRLELWHHSLS